ncbi:MAG: DsbA family protein [Candidatus Komeilibacteria bacterium]
MKTHNIMKPWYKKWWGVLIIFLGIFLLASILSFSWAVYERVQELRDEQFVSLRQDYLEGLAPGYSPRLGSENPVLTIVEFSDFQCPFCAESAPIMKQIMNEYGGLVQFVYRHMPVDSLHPDAWNASLASTCADEQNAFWTYHDKLFTEQDNLSKDNLFAIAENLGMNMDQFKKCFDSEKYASQVRRDMNDGAELEIEGTPTFFANGEMLSGVLRYDQWKIILDAFLLNE